MDRLNVFPNGVTETDDKKKHLFRFSTRVIWPPDLYYITMNLINFILTTKDLSMNTHHQVINIKNFN